MPLLVLAGILPLIVIAILYASGRAAKRIREEGKENLALNAELLAESMNEWTNYNYLMLKNLSQQSAIIGMNPEEQHLELNTLTNNYEHIYLAMVVAPTGFSVAKNDDKKMKYYGDRIYIKNAMKGDEITYEAIISRTNGKPAVCMGTPIRNKKTEILGVAAICTNLDIIAKQVDKLRFGQTGYGFVVDEEGNVLAHSEKKFTSGDRLEDKHSYPPVQRLLSGDSGLLYFTDYDGIKWISYSIHLNNGWGVVINQQQSEFFQDEQEFLTLALFIATVTVLGVSVVTWLIGNRAIAPLANLTNAAIAIANGKWNYKLKTRRQDELGILTNSFNRMRIDLKSLFANLEERIEQRTAQLKQAKEAAEEAKVVAESANQSKDRFIANISHELRTPLNSIIGYNRLVQRDKELKPIHSQHLKTVERSSIYLLNLINELLDISQAQLDRITLYPTDLELTSFLNEILALVKMSAQEKNIILENEYNNLPLWIQSDRKRLQQILLNLLSNGIKFTPQGGEVALKVTAIESLKINQDPLPQQKIKFEVKDTGVGMKEEDVKKIFKPFEQVGNIKDRSESAGLGLSICSELVKLMGGKLQVITQLGMGSIFWFEIVVPVLPRLKEVEPEGFKTLKTINKETYPKILVVDDKQLNRNLLIEILQPKGFEVFTANNGEEMLNLAKDVKPDLILLDLFMPVKTGFTSAKELRQNPQLKDIPIIVVTASSITEEVSNYLDCEAVLQKPIDEDKLLILLNRHLSKTTQNLA